MASEILALQVRTGWAGMMLLTERASRVSWPWWRACMSNPATRIMEITSCAKSWLPWFTPYSHLPSVICSLAKHRNWAEPCSEHLASLHAESSPAASLVLQWKEWKRTCAQFVLIMLFETSQLSSDICFSEVLIFDRPSHVRHPLLLRFLLSCIHCPANSGREFVKKLSINNLDVKISRFLCWIGAWLHADDLQHIRFRAALSRDANQPASGHQLLATLKQTPCSKCAPLVQLFADLCRGGGLDVNPVGLKSVAITRYLHIYTRIATLKQTPCSKCARLVQPLEHLQSFPSNWSGHISYLGLWNYFKTPDRLTETHNWLSVYHSGFSGLVFLEIMFQELVVANWWTHCGIPTMAKGILGTISLGNS